MNSENTGKNAVVDRTGAGDCFFAGFLTKYIENHDPYISSLYGSAATSYLIERSGGVIKSRMPDIKEVDRRAKLIQEIIPPHFTKGK